MAFRIFTNFRNKVVLFLVRALQGIQQLLVNTFQSVTMERPLEHPGDKSEEATTNDTRQWKRRIEATDSSNNDSVAKHAKLNTQAEAVDNAFSINDLPHNILIKFCQKLPMRERLKLCLVSKFWYNLVNDRDLWHRINVRDIVNVDDAVLLRLTSISKFVTSLDMSGLRLVTADGFVSMLQQCPHLQSLKTYACSNLGERALAAVGKYCHKLTYLSMDNCEIVTDLVLEAVAQGCPRLETLRIGHASTVTSVGIAAISKHCPRLSYLVLDECRMVDDVCLEELTTGCLEMHSLCLNNTKVTCRGIALLGRLKKLDVLEISRLRGMTQDGLVSSIKRCRTLSNLSINLCAEVTDKVVEAIAKNIPNLQQLCLVNCKITNEALVHLGNYSHALDNLDVSWCEELTDEGVEYVTEKCPRLTYLSLMRCDLVTGATVEALMERFPQIHFSTMDLDYRRLLEKARKAGALPPAKTSPTPEAGEKAGEEKNREEEREQEGEEEEKEQEQEGERELSKF